ncbi:MAG: proline--tRNA ligase [Candidatus Cloacimonetes bacterium]|nr:proline--tRNA ligase [Candidatus Cloacimonadota bacterium]MCF7813240.1 proline--tRNA ligase [Candidatus Cloacimonadota bacterium]MCF7867439.1 proline--tRNA ligase [Candidatus Cloacimonadota bacterium]MCF7882929.1 proline--tRNA ligase [Candidatus Cloacimonadota bacterium]
MAKQARTAITPTREENYPAWYQQVVKAADMAENSDVRGCMVIKPWGYAIWENIQRELDDKFKETGHVNAYFPLFIPKSFFEKEAEHVEGFAKECAVVTHSRLEDDGKGGLKPAGPLTEELIVRPTSETIIGASFSKWVNSYRDLPLLINQWANVVRWELRTRLFLRTTEFLWQEGHTVHATKQEAIDETMMILKLYADFAREFLAMPVIEGEKTESERFPGAESTFTFEAMMQDKKALQAGTSHFLGQKFAKASEIKFQNAEGFEEFAWTTSWGVTTRLIGALVMTHSDDNGLILPPRITPTHVVIVPIYRNEEEKKLVMDFTNNLIEKTKVLRYHEKKIQIHVDDRDLRGGEKLWEWIKKGVPIRLEIGPRDIQNNSVFMGRRDKAPKDKKSLNADDFVKNITSILDEMQINIYQKALKFRKENTFEIDDKDEFYKFFTPKNEENPEIHGGFAYSHWCGNAACEEKIKNDLKVTIRCIPLDSKEESGKCFCCGNDSKKRVILAKSY